MLKAILDSPYFVYFVIFVWFCAGIGLIRLFNRGTYYKVEKTGISFYSFGLKNLFIEFSDISEIRLAQNSDMIRLWLKSRSLGNFGNNFLGRIVLIYRENGFPKEVWITPNDASNFVKNIKKLINNA